MLATSGSLAALAFAGCLSDDDDGNGNGSSDDHDDDHDDNHDDDHDLPVAEFDVLDRDHDEDVLVYIHGDHWHDDPLEIPHDDYLSLGASVEDEDGDEIELGDGIDLEVDIVSGDDVIDVDFHGDHVHIHGEDDGFADITFQLVEDGEVGYETPELEVDVGDHDHDDHDDHGHAEVEELKILDRAEDPHEQVAAYHDDHWDGELPHVHVDAHVSLGGEFYDDHGDEIPIGGSEEYELGVRVADDANEDIVKIDDADDFHGDHVHIHGEADGETEVVFMLWHDDHADWESEPLAITVEDH